jgi:hypothetical protein
MWRYCMFNYVFNLIKKKLGSSICNHFALIGNVGYYVCKFWGKLRVGHFLMEKTTFNIKGKSNSYFLFHDKLYIHICFNIKGKSNYYFLYHD